MQNTDCFPKMEALPHDTIRRILTLLDGNALYENTIQGFYLFLESMKNHYSVQGD